jgi:hypothetical protein
MLFDANAQLDQSIDELENNLKKYLICVKPQGPCESMWDKFLEAAHENDRRLQTESSHGGMA